jgi:tetratricopeptide (TPR) repeat protein
LRAAKASSEVFLSGLPKIAVLFWCCGVFCVLPALAESPTEVASRAAQAMQEGHYQDAEQLYSELTRLQPNLAEAYSNLGLARYYQKKFDVAETAFRTALSLNTELFVPKVFLGDIYVGRGKYAEALPFAEQAVKEQPRENAARRLLATVWLGLGRQDQAVDQYQKVLEQDPRDEDALYHLALAYLELGHRAIDSVLGAEARGFAAFATAEFDATRPGFQDFAVNEYRKAIGEAPSVPGLRVALANLLLRTEKWQQAQEALKEELGVDPFSYEARVGLAQIAVRDGEFDAAIRSLDEAARIRPEFFAPLPEFTVTTPPGKDESSFSILRPNGKPASFGQTFLLSRLAAARYLEQEAANWQSMAEQLRDKLIQDYKTQSQKASTFIGNHAERRALGLKYLREKRFETGLKILLPDAATWRSDPQVRAPVLRALFRLQRFQEAVQVLRGLRMQTPEDTYILAASYRGLGLQNMQQLLHIDPDSPDLHRSLGDAYSALYMYDQAVEQYEAALKIQPRNGALHFALGEVRFSQMKFEEAAQAYARATEFDSMDPNPYMMQGASLLQMHRAEEAIPPLRRAVELQPKFAAAHGTLGKALAQVGRDREAVQELESAAGSDTDGSFHYLLFSLYTKFGEKEKAKQALQDSNRLNQEARNESKRKLERNIESERSAFSPGR